MGKKRGKKSAEKTDPKLESLRSLVEIKRLDSKRKKEINVLLQEHSKLQKHDSIDTGKNEGLTNCTHKDKQARLESLITRISAAKQSNCNTINGRGDNGNEQGANVEDLSTCSEMKNDKNEGQVGVNQEQMEDIPKTERKRKTKKSKYRTNNESSQQNSKFKDTITEYVKDKHTVNEHDIATDQNTCSKREHHQNEKRAEDKQNQMEDMLKTESRKNTKMYERQTNKESDIPMSDLKQKNKEFVKDKITETGIDIGMVASDLSKYSEFEHDENEDQLEEKHEQIEMPKRKKKKKKNKRQILNESDTVIDLNTYSKVEDEQSEMRVEEKEKQMKDMPKFVKDRHNENENVNATDLLYSEIEHDNNECNVEEKQEQLDDMPKPKKRKKSRKNKSYSEMERDQTELRVGDKQNQMEDIPKTERRKRNKKNKTQENNDVEIQITGIKETNNEYVKDRLINETESNIASDQNIFSDMEHHESGGFVEGKQEKMEDFIAEKNQEQVENLPFTESRNQTEKNRRQTHNESDTAIDLNTYSKMEDEQSEIRVEEKGKQMKEMPNQNIFSDMEHHESGGFVEGKQEKMEDFIAEKNQEQVENVPFTESRNLTEKNRRQIDKDNETEDIGHTFCGYSDTDEHVQHGQWDIMGETNDVINILSDDSSKIDESNDNGVKRQETIADDVIRDMKCVEMRKCVEIDEVMNEFSINKDVWEEIKPQTKEYGKSRKQVRKMTKPWTDVFSDRLNEIHKGCIFRFKDHHVKLENSRKSQSPFFLGEAVCIGNDCNAKFVFEIKNEPKEEENITVTFTVKGEIHHTAEEINRRNVSGKKRTKISDEIKKAKSVNNYFLENLHFAKTEEIESGNYTSTPNPNVLRKIVSEQIQKENFHQNILAELEILKENYEREQEPYIQDIGLDPFCLIMFSQRQINLMKDLSAQNELNIYIDATGCIISNIKNQKRPYLYSVVVKPNPKLPAVSVADMVTTQHCIPRIELFLSTLNRSIKLTGKSVKINKVETDYSMALIQACLRTYNNMDLKTYVQTCFNIMITDKSVQNITVIHLCAAHILRDFIRKMKKASKASKNLKKLVNQYFQVLQNVTSLEEGKQVFRDICLIFLNENNIPGVSEAMKSLEKRCCEDYEDEMTEEDQPKPDTDESSTEGKTIKESSPYTNIFMTVKREVQEEIEDNKQECQHYERNPWFYPDVVDCLLDSFMYLFPMWTGLMLQYIATNETCSPTRDSNSPVENWFKMLKNDAGLKSHERPARFVLKLRSIVYAKLIELQFPGVRLKKSRKKTTEPEEIWKKSKKSKTTPMPKFKTKKTNPENDMKKTNTAETKPTVPHWGGQFQDNKLVNTCTIDNGLTILHMKCTEEATFRDILEKRNEPIYQTLLTVFKFMSDKQFSEAKFVWITFIKKRLTQVTNLYGDEAEYFFQYIDREWVSTTTSICSNIQCPRPREQSRDVRGVNISITKPVNTLQQVLEIWLKSDSPCHARTCDGNTTPDSSDETYDVCNGPRCVTRRIIAKSPVLVIRVYEHCLNGVVNLDNILSCEIIKVGDSVYALAGVTFHRGAHYCSVIVSGRFGQLWYDGLAGILQPMPSDIHGWIPCHALFCQVA